MSSPFDGRLGKRKPIIPLPLTAPHILPGSAPHTWAAPASSPADLTLETSLRPEFGHVHPAASLSISLMRTPRVPGRYRGWPLHSALGRLPIARVSQLGADAPYHWHQAGGVAVPMYRSEAAWLRFRSPTGYPFAVKVLSGGINAISGDEWRAGLATEPANHLVVPSQSWLDGVHLGGGRVRQFAADAIEEADGSDGEAGGSRLQVVVTPLKGSEWARRSAEPQWPRAVSDDDPWRQDVWDHGETQTCVIRMVPAASWPEVVGHPVPHAPLGWHVFERSGLPWADGFALDAEVPHSGVHLVP